MVSPLVVFPRVTDPRGSLTYAQNLPFDIRRVYWIHDLSADAARGGHAHRQCHRVIVPVSGSFDAIVDGHRWHMSKPWVGVHVRPMQWLDMENFSGGACVLALASHEYDETDYVRVKADLTR